MLPTFLKLIHILYNGSEIPRIIPGSKQFWRSFGLDLVYFVEKRGLPDFFLTLTAYDGRPHVQSTLKHGWGAQADHITVQDLASTIHNREAVGFKPQISVLAAEKRYDWFMSILKSPEGGPLGIVEDLIMKKEYQRRGAVHWHTLLWVKPNSAPPHAVMAEMPRAADTSNKTAAYLRKLVDNMLQHKTCHPSRCFRGSHGKTLSKCKYGFPFEVPHNTVCLDEDHVRYLYTRRHTEDGIVVPYNPEISILWGASHSVQRVSKHGCEMYLAKYISKPEPSLNIELPENCSEPQKYLRTRVIGSVEAIEVLMGFHQNQMSRQVIFLQTELDPSQKMLKPKIMLNSLPDDSEDIYLRIKVETYLERPPELQAITYPEFFQWWRSTSPDEQSKATKGANSHAPFQIKCKGADDFQDYLRAKSSLQNGEQLLARMFNECEVQVLNSTHYVALKRSLQYKQVPIPIMNAIDKYYFEKGFDTNAQHIHLCIDFDSMVIAENICMLINLTNEALVSGLSAYHWLMDTNPPISAELTTILTTYHPGTVLADKNGHYWIRRAKMVITRHRFLNSAGDDTEKYYQQKYLLTVPIAPEDDIVKHPPKSWVELCASRGMCDSHLDALSCLQSAISKGFHTDRLRAMTQLYMDHGFLSADEADVFLSTIPALGEHDNEPNTTISDQILSDPDNSLDGFTSSNVSIDSILPTFTDSQNRAYKWVEHNFIQKKQVFAAIIGWFW